MSDNHSKAGDALTKLVLQVFRINGRLLVEGDRLMAPFRQTSSRWQVLGAIEAGAATVPTIARNMGISRQSVQRTADILESEGLCAFVGNPHHQKSPLLTLTKKGADLVKKIGRTQIQWVNGLATEFEVKELAAALEVLARLEHAIAGTTRRRSAGRTASQTAVGRASRP